MRGAKTQDGVWSGELLRRVDCGLGLGFWGGDILLLLSGTIRILEEIQWFLADEFVSVFTILDIDGM